MHVYGGVGSKLRSMSIFSPVLSPVWRHVEDWCADTIPNVSDSNNNKKAIANRADNLTGICMESSPHPRFQRKRLHLLIQTIFRNTLTIFYHLHGFWKRLLQVLLCCDIITQLPFPLILRPWIPYHTHKILLSEGSLILKLHLPFQIELLFWQVFFLFNFHNICVVTYTNRNNPPSFQTNIPKQNPDK